MIFTTVLCHLVTEIATLPGGQNFAGRQKKGTLRKKLKQKRKRAFKNLPRGISSGKLVLW